VLRPFRTFPHRIELNARGKIELSPASNLHRRMQARLASAFATQLPVGEAITECSVLTQIGIRVPDVGWASAEFLDTHGNSPFPRAPEICVEITSPSNSDDEITEKIRAYLAAGAREVWIVGEDGAIESHDRSSKQAKTSFNLNVVLPRIAK
jgi:Uma2 family endonuclease